MAPTAKSTTDTYTEHFLRRRRSSSADSGAAVERRNGLTLALQREDQRAVGETLELRGNGHQEAAVQEDVEEDSAVEKAPQRASVAAESGKGIAAVDGGGFGNRDQGEKAAMTKKRRAPRSRSAVALAVLAGAVSVSAAGGIAVCRMYPSSPAAISIRLAAGKAGEKLYPLLLVLQNEVGLYAKKVNEGLRAEWLMLLRSDRLEELACATQRLVEQIRYLIRTTSIVDTLAKSTRGQLHQVVLSFTGVLGILMTRVQTHAFTLGSELVLSDERVERVRNVLLRVRSSLEETLGQAVKLTKSSLNDVFERLGLEPGVSDVSVPTSELVDPLELHQATIQNIGSGLIVQESRALQDVKRFENRRVAIASAVNSIIADTRAIALESVLEVKMAAVGFIEDRIKQLAEQCAQSIELEIQKYEHTSREVEAVNDVDLLAEMAVEIQAQVEAALALKRKLLAREEVTDEELTEVQALGYEKNEVVIEVDIKEQYPDGSEFVEEGLSAQVTGPASLEEHSSLDSTLESTEEEVPLGSKMTEDGFAKNEVKETPVEDLSTGVYINEEQIHVAAEPAEPDLLTVEYTEVQVLEDVRSSTDDDHATQIAATLVKEDATAVEMEFAEAGELTSGEMTRTSITEVSVVVDDLALDVKETHVDVLKFSDANNLSQVDSSAQDMVFEQKEQIEVRVSVPIDGTGTDTEQLVEFRSTTTESTERSGMEQVQSDVSTRIDSVSASAVLNDEYVKKSKEVKAVTSALSRVDTKDSRMYHEGLTASDSDIAVHSEEQAFGAVHDVEMTVEEVDLVVAKLEPSTTESTSDEFVEVLEVKNGTVPRKETVDIEIVAMTSDSETLETDSVVVANEFQELEQLEQVLLQEEGERVRVEKELRVIAEKEEIWQQSEQHAVENGGGSRTATKSADSDQESVGQQSGIETPAAELSMPTLMQISLFSIVFLALALLAGYLLAHYRKRGLLAPAPRRRRRWQRLDTSDAEVVMLLPDDSSDEEVEADTTIMKSSLEVMELMSVNTRAMVSSGGEDADGEEETCDGHEEGGKEKFHAKEITEDGGVAVPDSESTKSKTVIVEHFQTTTDAEDRPVTSSSEAAAVEAAYSSGVGATTATPPGGSPAETPDTSQRARRRRRRESRT
ncbi:unnamed protein product [Phytophthora fragariaefolia]|uniref:Unnamed protein product n=1 Tax=Phytophthora fragariaefolia TaxID=1490495 RepID=A0A9W6XI38_9STRA|nr:unnamed protein product [Phytophthora fragariaefolia]